MDISLAPIVLGEIFGIPITNSLWVTFTISLVLVGFFALISRNLKEVPGKLQLIIEELLTFCKNFVLQTTNDAQATKWLFPLFATLGLFFLSANLIAYIPGLGAFTFDGKPLYRTATADYGLIIAITLGIFVAMHVFAIKLSGFGGYLKKFFNFSSPLDFVMGILDIISEIAKVISLSFRLFGNVFAGEVLAIVLFGIMPYLLPVPMGLLTLISAVVQAFVFPILVIIYFSLVIESAKQMAKT